MSCLSSSQAYITECCLSSLQTEIRCKRKKKRGETRKSVGQGLAKRKVGGRDEMERKTEMKVCGRRKRLLPLIGKRTFLEM